MAEQYPALKDRPVKETICLFDVDGTLTPARKRVSPEMLKLLSEVRHKCAIGFVGSTQSENTLPYPAKCPLPSMPVSLQLHTRCLACLHNVPGRRLGPCQTTRTARD